MDDRSLRIDPVIDETSEFDFDLTAPIQGARPLLEASTPMGRFGNTDDIAYAAVCIASEEAKFVMGQTLSPNGGFVMSQ
ncbi:MAG: SDR family oxidoreductase [Candidatus Binatia bacterium]|nr:SDR family oxidoreductase [Candidatus Binatia bacterium]